MAATGCHVGGRTLRILDFGKVAATFIDTCTEEAFRILPRREARSIAVDDIRSAPNKWQAMLIGYQTLPTSELFQVQQVQLAISLSEIISRPSKKSVCEVCEEEIINGREIVDHGVAVCRACAGESYYQILETSDAQREVDPMP